MRAAADPAAAWNRWRAGRDELFRTHRQSPLAAEARGAFGGIPYYGYEPRLRLEADVEPLEAEPLPVATSAAGSVVFRPFALARFALDGPRALRLYWLEGYGGGVFLPFRDATSGDETYGGGRYLLDTVKGADLGSNGERLVLDFNFAYNPSCSYDDRWACPLAPPENRLPVAVRAGERSR